MGFIPAPAALLPSKKQHLAGIKLALTRLLLRERLCPGRRNVQTLPGAGNLGIIKRASAAYFGQPIQEYCQATERFWKLPP